MSSHLMATYNRADIAFERGEGSWLFTAEGKKYLDFTSGIAVTNLGHCHPHLIEALTKQGQKLWHCSNLFRIPEGERLADRLAEITFADAIFFSNSGAEAIEGAIKLARKFHQDAGNKNRYRVLTCSGSFHGRTLAALAAAGNPKYLKGFDPVTEGFTQVPFMDLEAMKKQMKQDVAAILVEPVQGEGGFKAASPEYLQGLRKIADENGALLIFDEVQCGMGRSGKLFAHEYAGVTPDIMTTAKGIGNGFPLGAILAKTHVAKSFGYGAHGSTYGGNPLAMAIGNAVLDIMLAPGFLTSVGKSAIFLDRQLQNLKVKYPQRIIELRGMGLMRGVRLPDDIEATAIIGALRDHGLLVLSAGENVLRLLPPLIVTEEEIQIAIDSLDKVLVQI